MRDSSAVSRPCEMRETARSGNNFLLNQSLKRALWFKNTGKVQLITMKHSRANTPHWSYSWKFRLVKHCRNLCHDDQSISIAIPNGRKKINGYFIEFNFTSLAFGWQSSSWPSTSPTNTPQSSILVLQSIGEKKSFPHCILLSFYVFRQPWSSPRLRHITLSSNMDWQWIDSLGSALWIGLSSWPIFADNKHEIAIRRCRLLLLLSMINTFTPPLTP